jgi:outer membrane protein assembly factor BamB
MVAALLLVLTLLSAAAPLEKPADGTQAPSLNGDWPQWRGPNRDGAVHGVRVPKQWPKALTEAWKVTVGEGAASPVVVAGNVYVFVRLKDNEVMVCLDLADGKERWRSEPSPAPFKPGPGDAFSNGPRSTPAIADGRVFALGISGILSCLDARTGRLLWRKNYQPYYNRSGNSPLVADGLCITHMGTGKSGGVRAFDVATGDVKWCFDHGSPAASSPILVTLAGERQVVTFTAGDLIGLSFATGKLLWQTPCTHDYFENCVTPVLANNLLIAPGRMQPPRAFRLEKGDKGIAVREVWKAKATPSYMSSPIVAGDWLFGHADQKMGQLFCLDARTGATLWEASERLGSYATVVNAGSVWLVLTNKGQLIVVKASGTAYEPIAEYRVADREAWSYPVFLGDRIVIKDDRTLRCYRIEAASAKD